MNVRSVLTPRALAAWAGTDRLSALAFHLPPGPHQTEAARLFAVLVGGDTDPDPDRERARARARDTCTCTYTMLRDRGLLALDGKSARATVSILPLGPSLLVCDRLDADGGTNVVCWPDDSSYHLALSIPPGRRARWLDLATGAAFAPLMRPELAETIVGAELNPHAVELARHGVALSGLEQRIAIAQADLTAGIDGTFDLVTCNAPIPADVGPLWRATADQTFFPRLFGQVPRVLAPGGLFVLHAALEHIAALVEQLPGERVTVSYVPEGGRQFGVLWWEPDRPARHIVARRELTADRPHLTHADRAAALA